MQKTPTKRRQALVVEGDSTPRNEIAEILSAFGFEVSSCDSLEAGRRFYRNHPLVVAGEFGENGDVQVFVDYVRDLAGEEQPYIIRMIDGADAYAKPAGTGVNDVVAKPIDQTILDLKLKAAKHWIDRQRGIEEEVITDGEDDAEEEVDAEDELRPMRAAARRLDESGRSLAELELHLLIDACPAGLALFDGEMRYVVASRRWKEAFGLEDEEIIGRSHHDIFLEVSPDWELLCQDCLEAGVAQCGSELVEWADGSSEWVRWTMSPWEDDDGAHGGIAVTFESIPDPRLIIRQEVGAEENDLASLLAQSGAVPVLVLDLEGNIVRSNRKARELGLWQKGKSRQRFGEVYLERETREEFEEDFLRFADRAEEQGVFDFPAVSIESAQGGDGSARRVAWHNFPRHESDGSINGLIRVGIDAGEMTPESASASGATAAEVWMDLMPQPFFKLRKSDGNIVFTNRAWSDLRGEEQGGGEKTVSELVHQDDRTRLEDALGDLRESGERVNLPVRLAGKNGSTRWFRFVVDPMRFGNSAQGEEIIGYCEDTGTQKHLEEELAQLQARHDELLTRMKVESDSKESFESDVVTAKGELEHLREELAREKADRSEFEAERKEVSSKSTQIKEALQKFKEVEAALKGDLDDALSELESLRGKNVRLSEERQRFAAISESAPFGIVVLSRNGSTLYANPGHLGVVGSDIRKAPKFEEWLGAHCPDDSPAAIEALVKSWREEVWRKQQTRAFPVRADDDSVRELEFRPKMLKEGQFLISIFDVTDARRSEEALVSSEAKFRALFQDAGVPIALVDTEGKVYDANSALEKLLGLSRMDILRKKIVDLIAEKDRSAQTQLLRELEASHAPSGNAQIHLLPSKGKEFPAEMQVTLVRNVDGKVMFTAYFFRVVEGATTGLVTKPARLPGPRLSAAPDTIVAIDTRGVILDWIPGVSAPSVLAGVVREDVAGKSIKTVLPSLGKEFTTAVSSAKSGTSTVEFSIDEKGAKMLGRVACSKKGNIVISLREAPAEDKAAPAEDKSAAMPVGVELDEGAVRQRLALMNMHDGVVVTDLKGRITDWNSGARRMFGYEPDEILGKGLYLLYSPEEPKSFKQSFSRGISTDRLWKSETEYTRKDGTTGLCEAVFVPTLDEKGRATGLVGTNRELNAPREAAPVAKAPEESSGPARMEGGAAGAESRAMLQARMKDNMDTIRTLLNLQMRSLKDAGALNALGSSQMRVEALAILQKYESDDNGVMTIDFGKFVREFVQYLLEEIGPEETGIEVHLNVKNLHLSPDTATPLALILNELLTNSLRHAFKGRETGMVSIASETGAGKRELVVKDDGAGLPDWLQIDESPGLGLQIVQALSQQVGGSVRLGKGLETEFHVSFKMPG